MVHCSTTRMKCALFLLNPWLDNWPEPPLHHTGIGLTLEGEECHSPIIVAHPLVPFYRTSQAQNYSFMSWKASFTLVPTSRFSYCRHKNPIIFKPQVDAATSKIEVYLCTQKEILWRQELWSPKVVRSPGPHPETPSRLDTLQPRL